MHRHSRRRRKPSRESLALSIESMEPRLVCAAGISLALANDTGRRANDRITSNATLAISRPLAAGQRVEYRVTGAAFRTAVMADARRFVPEGIGADGSYRVVARVVDGAGRPAALGPALAFRLDRSATPLQVVLKQDTGASASDRISSNGGLVVSGQEPNALVQYSRDNGTWDPATAVWGGYSPQPGLNRWRVRQVDLAGNASASAAIEFELDTERDERVVRVEGPSSGSFDAAAGQRIVWVLEFEKPMYGAAAAARIGSSMTMCSRRSRRARARSKRPRRRASATAASSPMRPATSCASTGCPQSLALRRVGFSLLK
jgi:hypothetical protein